MDSIEIDGVTYTQVKEELVGSCEGCVAFGGDDILCDKICQAIKGSCLLKEIIWTKNVDVQKQVELNRFFNRPLTEQIEMFPETLAVTQEEEEDWREMQKKVATGVTDGTRYHRQVGGDHYFNPIQPWDIIRAWELNYWEGNIVKYVLRHKGKNKVEDLEKARHYLDYLIENYDELYPVSN